MGEYIFLAGIAAFVMLISLVLQVLTLNLTRKNVYLGVRIPEEKREDAELKAIGKKFVNANFIIGIPSIMILTFLIYTFKNIEFFMVSIFGFLLIIFMIYFSYNKKVRILKQRNSWLHTKKQVVIVDTSFSKEKSSKSLPSSWWFIIPVLIMIINIIINMNYYNFLPDRVPTHWDFNGQINGYQNKSHMLLYEMPLVGLLTTGVMFISYKSIGWAKQELSSINPQESKERNMIFRRVWSIYFIVSTIGINLIFTIGNLQIMQVTHINNTVSMIFILGFSMILVVSSIVISVKVGQGGSKLKLETGEKQSAICNRDDDKHWILANSIYYNPEDPAVFIEKRFGIGWTVNAGTLVGKAIYIGTILIILCALGVSFFQVK